MTLKEQERKAMNQIKEIVEGLGDFSYIGTAMDGVWEIMEENIENDFAISARDKIKAHEKEVSDLTERISCLSADLSSTKYAADMTERELAEAKDEINQMSELLDKNEETIRDLNEAVSDARIANGNLVIENTALKDEIVRLKARLYDFMVKGAA